MDALSGILKLIRLKSSVYFRKDFASPWGMEIGKSPFAQFHLVVRGHCYLHTDDMKDPMDLYAGDIIVFPKGKSHWLADNPESKKIPGIKVVEAHKNNEILFEGETISTTLICGHFEFDKDFEHPFLQSLPELIHITDTERRQLSWLESATNVIMQEADSDEPGSEVVVNRLAEVLFIQIIRVYIVQSNNNCGYLAALKDKHIHNALSLIHHDPQNSWTLESIARTIGMSRSAFAARFKQLTGNTPMNYLTNWRMNKARELIKIRQLPLLEVAEQVGYSSEAAFNRAFKKQFSCNPGAMRRSFLL